jgi:hypothetical protein
MSDFNHFPDSALANWLKGAGDHSQTRVGASPNLRRLLLGELTPDEYAKNLTAEPTDTSTDDLASLRALTGYIEQQTFDASAGASYARRIAREKTSLATLARRHVFGLVCVAGCLILAGATFITVITTNDHRLAGVLGLGASAGSLVLSLALTLFRWHDRQASDWEERLEFARERLRESTWTGRRLETELWLAEIQLAALSAKFGHNVKELLGSHLPALERRGVSCSLRANTGPTESPPSTPLEFP